MHVQRRTVVVTLLVAATIGVIVGAVLVLGADDDSVPDAAVQLSAVVARQTPAEAPFEGLGEVRVAIGGHRCLRLAVADSLTERVAGLRDHNELGPYDGMLFAYPGPTDGGFTMSGVTVPLDIGFYGADGTPDSHRHMRPCPDKTTSQCPDYRADGDYVYAVETHRGGLPSGALTTCSA